MAIYEARGFSNNLHLFDKKAPFDYVAEFRPLVVPTGADIEEYKRTQAPYCISGKVKAEKDGSYKRNNANLVYRDLIFLDYDEITGTSQDFIESVSRALFGYSYILYPTIKHTAESPRFRLVVKPSHKMKESTYRAMVQEIADKIGLPFDSASLTWSQLQGLPVRHENDQGYTKIVERGLDYPVSSVGISEGSSKGVTTSYTPRANAGRSITMRVVDTLLNGFGDEGGRNNNATRFIGLLFNRWVDCDIETAYELTQIANNVTNQPLPVDELDRTFASIARAEYRKRG